MPRNSFASQPHPSVVGRTDHRQAGRVEIEAESGLALKAVDAHIQRNGLGVEVANMLNSSRSER